MEETKLDPIIFWKKVGNFILINFALLGLFSTVIVMMHFEFIIAEIYINTQRQNMAYSTPETPKRVK